MGWWYGAGSGVDRVPDDGDRAADAVDGGTAGGVGGDVKGMTQTYTWNPMPPILAVRCPDCEAGAVFEFAEMALIRRKADIPYFQSSKNFSVLDYYSSGWKKLAIFWHQLGNPLSAINDFPTGYDPGMWAHSEYLVRKGPGDLGTIVCAQCGLRRKHVLEWPGNAWFQIDYRGQVLWAFERSSMVALTNFIASKDRQKAGRPWAGFLMKIPSLFLEAKAREAILRKLRARLGMQGA